ncbi:ThiF family adenylyltransferase [Nonomuraea sp. N2-4H]
MRFPRVKPEHAPSRSSDGTIRLGGVMYGIASEIEDPDGWAWAALTLMDGTRPTDEITAELAKRFTELTPEEAGDIVATLLSSGHVEEADPGPCAELSEREKERYSRSRDFYRWIDLTPRDHGWEPQLRIKAARVLVIGLGGTGGHVAWSLAASGVGRLHLVDPDVVELSNLNRQLLYTEADIGRPKVEVALDRLRRLNSDIEITGESATVAGPMIWIGWSTGSTSSRCARITRASRAASRPGRTGSARARASPGSAADTTAPSSAWGSSVPAAPVTNASAPASRRSPARTTPGRV